MLLAPKSRHHHHRSPRTLVEDETNNNMSAAAMNTVGNATGASVAGVGSGVDAINAQQGGSTSGNRKESAVTTGQQVTTTWFLRFCKVLNLVTGIAAVLGVITNLSILLIPSPAPDVALRIYGIAFCLLSVLTELEWGRLFSWFGVLESWIGRGMNNIFCGVLILVFDDTSAVSSDEAEGGAARTWLLRKIAGNFLVSMGCIYLFGGLACLNRIRDRHMNKIKKRDQALVQRQELETRKQEIELLLRDTESQLEKI